MRRYTDEERVDLNNPLRCYDCGLLYGSDSWVEAVVPEYVWVKINPTHDYGGGILCINCIAKRCDEAGFCDVPVKITAGPLVVDTSEMQSSHDELTRVEWELFKRRLIENNRLLEMALWKHARPVYVEVIHQLVRASKPYETFPTGVEKWITDLQQRSVELDEMIEWNQWLGKHIQSLMKYVEELMYRPDCPKIFRKQIRAVLKQIDEGV